MAKKKQIEDILTRKTVIPQIQPQVETPKEEVKTFNPKEPSKKIEFPTNPKGNVKVTIQGGETKELTREEYKTYSGRGGKITQNIEKLNEESERNALKRRIDAQLRQGATIQEITQELLGEQQAKEQAKVMNLEDIQMQASNPIDKTNDKKSLLPKPFDYQLEEPFKYVSEIKDLVTKGELPDDAIKSLKPIGQLYDIAQSIFSGGKGLEQKEAEATFSDIKSSFANDLTLVKAGIKDPIEVVEKIRRARDANSVLHSSISGLNKINLRYFLLNGRDVEAQIIENEEFLKDIERQLALTIQEGRLAQSQSTYGQ